MSETESTPKPDDGDSGGEPATPVQPVEPLYAPDRYCLRCQEPLPWYDEGPIFCPRCRFACDPNDPRTFLTRRTRVGWKYWFPGFALAVISGVLSYALCLQTGELGIALFFAVPISFGAILGYGTRVEVWLAITLAVVAISSVAGLLIAMHAAGIFCGCTLAIVFLAPTFVGIILGISLRAALVGSRWDQRSFFPLVVFLLFPYVAQGLEMLLPREMESADVRTELVMQATPDEAWEAVMFYEEVEHDPPWLLYLALPKPIASEGDKRRVGEVVYCRYDRGHLAKRITRAEPGKVLAFDVVEQQLHFERDVALKSGTIEIEPLDDGRTRVVLTTHYQRKLSPRLLWRPMEYTVIHTLHAHVLEGMRRKAEAEQGGLREPGDRTGGAMPGDVQPSDDGKPHGASRNDESELR